MQNDKQRSILSPQIKGPTANTLHAFWQVKILEVTPMFVTAVHWKLLDNWRTTTGNISIQQTYQVNPDIDCWINRNENWAKSTHLKSLWRTRYFWTFHPFSLCLSYSSRKLQYFLSYKRYIARTMKMNCFSFQFQRQSQTKKTVIGVKHAGHNQGLIMQSKFSLNLMFSGVSLTGVRALRPRSLQPEHLSNVSVQSASYFNWVMHFLSFSFDSNHELFIKRSCLLFCLFHKKITNSTECYKYQY